MKNKVKQILWGLIHDIRVEKDDDEVLIENTTNKILALFKKK